MLAVVARAQLLSFNVSSVLAGFARSGRRGSHGHPAAPGGPAAVGRGVGAGALPVWSGSGMAAQRQVLVELVHVESLHVADDVRAEL